MWRSGGEEVEWWMENVGGIKRQMVGGVWRIGQVKKGWKDGGRKEWRVGICHMARLLESPSVRHVFPVRNQQLGRLRGEGRWRGGKRRESVGRQPVFTKSELAPIVQQGV